MKPGQNSEKNLASEQLDSDNVNCQAPPLPEVMRMEHLRGLGGEVSEVNEPYRMYTTDANQWNFALKENARTNRKQPTEAENHLWQELRGSKLGVRFRRQHAILRFIEDFVCLETGLVVEVDGSIHAEAGQAEYDEDRIHELQQAGYRMLRFTNDDVLHRTAHVLQTISAHLVARPST